MNTPKPPITTPAGELSADLKTGPKSTCRRCGTCCEKGGPALHTGDAALVEEGKIPLSSLFTLRAGERVYDNVRGILTVLDREVIRIRGKEKSSVCQFYDTDVCGCRIYAHRPLECRILTCWDTTAIEHIYDRNRLVRKDLLAGVKGLWGLIITHESRCNHAKLTTRIARLKSTPDRALEIAICETIAFDRTIRTLCVDKNGLDPQLLDFLFGRPLLETIGAYGITVTSEDPVRLRLQASFGLHQTYRS